MVRLPLSPVDLERGQRLGALLRDARGARSILAVALDAGVSPETLRKIETGRIATPSFPTVAALAGVLGLSLDDVWRAVSAETGAAAAAQEAAPAVAPHAALVQF
ncbi:helix-turn-helix transcriptional regulator [Curtobacterium aetherium]|uniref:Helix-turn-helix domain-containing protein n=1 Tax=Curtobacterium aetherium TaxID=2841594 RepID=A0ACD1E4F1_9MICO|nr:helix-turn-helix transcriptional regulator [Curtobacterium sp. L6-1]QWS33725.1 helix-turn-helix domain-containing protein [Curtobacterium sp. L6-1]